jgi:hypothetical protein
MWIVLLVLLVIGAGALVSWHWNQVTRGFDVPYGYRRRITRPQKPPEEKRK